ncbi:MAG TPA: L,D-transpeptidase family protein [Gaiellaceae bacterium]|nr:L,D-transpeptidase family protein [Gaiellaceae bacterium]
MSRRIWLITGGSLVVLVLALFGTAFVAWPQIHLAASTDALARLDLPSYAGRVEQLDVRTASGASVPVSRRNGQLWPERKLGAGSQVTISVTVQHPSWISWLVGKSNHKTFTVTTPVTHIASNWVQVPDGSPVQVAFDQPAGVVEIDGQRNVLASATTKVRIPDAKPTGSALVKVAARAWETLTNAARVSWFPARSYPQLLARPAEDASLGPQSQITLTFSRPLKLVLPDGVYPTLKPNVPGAWVTLDDHTIAFRPKGLGFGLGATVHVVLPSRVHLVGDGEATTKLTWKVDPGSTLRLQELLAQLGYLPVEWTPANFAAQPVTLRDEFAAAVKAPHGTFDWRWSNTPASLTTLWKPGAYTVVTRGAVMMFEDEHGLASDGIAGPNVWRALFTALMNGDRKTDGYNYVFVHRNLPQSMNLWHNGNVILTSPGNTGIPQAPTQLGTFPVFWHIPVGTMSGTNPNGSKYHDPGVRYISYFNGGDALHAFPRASYGTPQSLGCVELPLDAAAKVWPYTPVGTLVTIEN